MFAKEGVFLGKGQVLVMARRGKEHYVKRNRGSRRQNEKGWEENSGRTSQKRKCTAIWENIKKPASQSSLCILFSDIIIQ